MNNSTFNILTFRGHNKCGVNIVANVSGDILFDVSLSAAIFNNLNSLCRKDLCCGVNSRRSNCKAVNNFVSDDSAFGGYCAVNKIVYLCMRSSMLNLLYIPFSVGHTEP